MDTWDGGASYENYMGRWSRQLAQRFVEWLDVPRDARWLDVGCGTGALTETIAAVAAPAMLAGLDLSPEFVDAARDRLRGRADLRVGDARALPFADDDFDAVVSGIALNFVPDPSLVVQEMRRVARSGGAVATYLWDYADGMEMIRTFWDAAIALDPTVAHLDEAVRFPLCRPEPMKALFSAAEIDDIEFVALEISTEFPSFETFWHPFLGGQGPAPSYVSSLDPPGRRRLEDRLREQLSTSSDGAIALTARAWAIRGAA